MVKPAWDKVKLAVQQNLGAAVFDTIIPRSVRLSEAPSYGLPIALYRPDSKGAEAYAALAAEMRERDGRPAPISRTAAGEVAPKSNGSTRTSDGGVR